MTNQSILKWLIPPICLLAVFAASMGLLYQKPGAPYSYTNHRGETIMVNGHGLYYYDSVSAAAQEQGNDIVTLVVGLPLLILSTWFAFHGSMRGQLLMTGTLGFFLYTYLSMSMLTSFNALFLVYVAVFTFSLFAFIVSLLSFDVKTLPQYFDDHTPHRGIAMILFVIAGFLLLAWLGKILPSLLPNAPRPDLQNATTMVIQAMDLGLLVPLATLAGILLLRRIALGYLLASVFVLKAITMGLAVSAMIVSMALSGVTDSPVIMVPFLLITVVNLGVAIEMLRHVTNPPRTILHPS